ncbi:hypothetical protein F5X97DRAFT_289795 [Nemania serpens]|nr:hypothetical protein F5X97DRAFT_289795 [Nemania serpens]
MAEVQRGLACPFLLKDPKNHMGCRKYQLNRIRDVKQHLLRVHRRPPYCPRCYDTFSNDEERDYHVRVCQVEDHPLVRINGVSDDQQRTLSKKSNSKHTVEEQWHFIWETLFPNTGRPTSVYLAKMFSDEMFLLRQYMATEGISIFRDCLNAHNAVFWMLPDNEADIASFQESVGRGVLEKVFEGWTDYYIRGVNSRPSSAQANISAATLPASGAPAPTTSEIYDPNLAGDQVPEGHAPYLSTASSISFSVTGSAAEVLETNSPPESDFDYLIDVLRPSQLFQ